MAGQAPAGNIVPVMMVRSASRTPHFRAVAFDLLSALLDSWSLWNEVAGGRETGRRWRMEYLRRTYGEERYRLYEELIREAAGSVELSRGAPRRLLRRWDELAPWPEAEAVLRALRRRVPVAVVTNCSEALAARAVAALGVDPDAVVTAESVGWYKPDPRPYRAAASSLQCPERRLLYVAGSPFDVVGAREAGFQVYWHDRTGLSPEHRHAPALFVRRTLHGLLDQFPAGREGHG